MKNEKNNNTESPIIFPQGWKKRVAKVLDIHQNTVTNNLKLGNGKTYERIIHTAKQIYSNPQK